MAEDEKLFLQRKSEEEDKNNCGICMCALSEDDAGAESEHDELEASKRLYDDRPVEDIMEDIAKNSKIIEQKQQTKIFVFENCSHIYHGGCLRQYFKNEIDDSRFPLRCPNVECKTEVSTDELEKLLEP